MADWEDDWENELKTAAPAKKPTQLAAQQVDGAEKQPKKKIVLEPMTLDDYKKMKELKMTIEDYQLKFKAPVIEKPAAPPVVWEEDWYGQPDRKSGGKGRDRGGKKQDKDDKGKGKKEKGDGKKGRDDKGKGRDEKGKGKGRDDKGGKGKKGTKGKGKEGVDFDDGVSGAKGDSKGGKGKGGKGKGGKGEYDAFWDDEHGAIVENYNSNAPELNQGEVNRNMMLMTREAFLGSGAGSAQDQDTHFTTKKWETQDNLCDLSFDALKDNFQYEYMTKVQAWSYPFITAGKDVLARSKVGTGKTLAFLVPTVEKIFKCRKVDVEKCYDSAQQDWYTDPNHKILMDEDNYVSALVISPTRELAQAIGDECYRLTSYWYKMFRTTIIYGGVKLHWDYDIYDKARIDMLVATPGRLSDHLQNTKDFSEKINNCPFSFTLILDEADRLLEMGFRDEIEKIIKYLPTNKRKKAAGEAKTPDEDDDDDDRSGGSRPIRQSLLFSATVPEMVHNVGKMALRSDYRFVDCGNDEEDAQKQEEQLTQKLLVCEPAELLETFFNLLLQAMREYPKNHKIMVFFITAKQTQFVSELANVYLSELSNTIEKEGGNAGGAKITTRVHEIHSRMPYADRDYVKQEFRDAKKGILFSSDVSAKSNDIENVTHVIQVGVPANKEQYLNRIGRSETSGKGVLILHPFEKYFLYQDLKEHPQLERINMRIGWEESAIQKEKISKCVKRCLKSTRRATYSAWLGFYNSIHIRRLRMTKEELVDTANKYATDVLELEEQPAILQNTIKKMGLKDVKGLKILEENEAAEEDWLEEDMTEEGAKKKKKSKWDEDESWWAESWDNYGRKSGKKDSKSKSKKWDESWDEWGTSKKDKKAGDKKKASNKEWAAEEGYSKEEWAAWEKEKADKKKAKKEKEKAAKEKKSGDEPGEKIGGATDMEQYFDEETGEMKFREKKTDKKKEKKEKAVVEEEYTAEEWAAWEKEQAEKKAAKKAAKEKKASEDKAAKEADGEAAKEA